MAELTNEACQVVEKSLKTLGYRSAKSSSRLTAGEFYSCGSFPAWAGTVTDEQFLRWTIWVKLLRESPLPAELAKLVVIEE